MTKATLLIDALFATIYAPALGHGFVKDDFRWIAAADLRSADDLLHVFSTNVGFYRPLVTTTFAVDRAIWKLDPRGYAVTNLTLLLADASLLFALGRYLSLSPAAAMLVVAVWLFNFHGINVALLWISGRTALLLCLFSLGAPLAWLRGLRLAAALLTLAAMLSKEEAIMLPPLLLLIDVVRAERGSVRAARAAIDSWPLWVAAAIYLMLRAESGAFGPSDAPSYYRLTFDPRLVLKNMTEYLDRGATSAVLAGIVMLLPVPWRTPVSTDQRHVVRVGLLWFVCMFAITVFVPVRSSLYAVAPSLGTALIAGAFAARAQAAAPRQFARACTALVAVVALLTPVYRLRDRGLVDPADLSTQALDVIRRSTETQPYVREIILRDDPAATITLDDAFGGLFPEAIRLFVSPDMRVTMSDGTPHADAQTGVMVFALRGGRLVRAAT